MKAHYITIGVNGTFVATCGLRARYYTNYWNLVECDNCKRTSSYKIISNTPREHQRSGR